MKQTGDRVSSLAGKYGRITAPQLVGLTLERATEIAADVRSMAASLRSQDETRGLRKLWKKVTGK